MFPDGVGDGVGVRVGVEVGVRIVFGEGSGVVNHRRRLLVGWMRVVRVGLPVKTRVGVGVGTGEGSGVVNQQRDRIAWVGFGVGLMVKVGVRVGSGKAIVSPSSSEVACLGWGAVRVEVGVGVGKVGCDVGQKKGSLLGRVVGVAGVVVAFVLRVLVAYAYLCR